MMAESFNPARDLADDPEEVGPLIQAGYRPRMTAEDLVETCSFPTSHASTKSGPQADSRLSDAEDQEDTEVDSV